MATTTGTGEPARFGTTGLVVLLVALMQALTCRPIVDEDSYILLLPGLILLSALALAGAAACLSLLRDRRAVT